MLSGDLQVLNSPASKLHTGIETPGNIDLSTGIKIPGIKIIFQGLKYLA